MSLFKRKKYLFILLIGVFLVGCSFQPAWVAKNQKTEILWERVDFIEAKTSNEFRLNRYLVSRLGKAIDAELLLTYELFTETKRSALSFDGKAFRIVIHPRPFARGQNVGVRPARHVARRSGPRGRGPRSDARAHQRAAARARAPPRRCACGGRATPARSPSCGRSSDILSISSWYVSLFL